ncbi:MAG: PQQ-dependent sugar dehydrogenase, partial [Candidatus Thermoplasmatota archaeon]|nr:PQQ-dependent sugar dehydrogenase [Candidatus Thermoplasmatota archaeon]
ITNIGDERATDIPWNIAIEGGTFGLVDTVETGIIDSIEPGETTIVESGFLFGFGNISIDIIVDSIGKTVGGSLFLFFVTINPEFIVNVDVIADGFNSPLYATSAGDASDRLFVVDQIGIIYVIQNDEFLSQPFLDISDKIVDLDTTYDERGLLGLAFHPAYEKNGRFFVYYSSPKSGENINHESILAEYHVSDNQNRADPDSQRIIFRVDQPEANHNGGQLLFGPDGYLYIGLGDGGGAGDNFGEIGNGQNKSTLLGSILRIDIDNGSSYSIPLDNPLVGKDGRDEIYAFGLRNPWHFSFDRKTNELFAADVGQDAWEEINIIIKGGNYGWRIMEGTHFYDEDLLYTLNLTLDDLEMPIHEYSHSVGISIIGGYVYRGTENPELAGKYIFGDWSTSFINPRGSLFYLEEIEPGSWKRFDLLPSDFNRFVLSFGEDENGEIYVLSKTTLGPTGSTGDIRKINVE